MASDRTLSAPALLVLRVGGGVRVGVGSLYRRWTTGSAAWAHLEMTTGLHSPLPR